MSLAVRRSGKCAFCAFRTSEWSTTLFRWQSGVKRHRSSTTSRPSSGSRSLSGGYIRSSASSRDGLSPDEKPWKRLQPAPEGSSYDVFAGLVWDQVKRNWVQQIKALEGRALPQGLDPSELREADKKLRIQLDHYSDLVKAAARRARTLQQVTKNDNPLFFQFRQAFIKGHIAGLAEEVEYRFIVSTLENTQANKSTDTLPFQKAVADLTHPIEWYPATRAMQREIHLHIGPTNSGKTYHALKRLEKAKSGIFAGPLRLLAHEVYTRFNAKGIKCALITGEEHRIPDGMNTVMNSCTVEMVPLNTLVDVCVIDEIQMLGDKERGWAWTNAFLGVQAKEIHLCGEVRTEQLVRSLCEAMGEKLVVHRYERLGLLEPQSKNLGPGNLKGLQKGDAVILFSRVAIHAMKKNIEKATGRRCAVVYGSLPPETRAAQANLFNDPDNEYDFLVASNAVGMGLNLNIKRIIFDTTVKHNGEQISRLETSEIKQIAGRAGRFKSAHAAIHQANIDNSNAGVAPTTPTLTSKAAIGYVNAFHRDDLHIIRKAMKEEVEPMKTAGILPPADVIVRFAAFFPADTAFSYVLLRLKELVQLHPSYHFCSFKDIIQILDLIQPYNLSVADRITFMAAPVSLRTDGFQSVVVEYAKALALRDGRDLLEFDSLPLELLDMDIHDHATGPRGYLRQAEMLHHALTLYLWLSYRFAGVYRLQPLCFHIKSLVEEKIDQCLAEINFLPHSHALRTQKYLERMEKVERIAKDFQVTELDGETKADGAAVLEDGPGALDDFEEDGEESDFLDDAEKEEATSFDSSMEGLRDDDVGVNPYPADDTPADGNIPEPPSTNTHRTSYIPEVNQSNGSTPTSIRE
jgi:ATP-dependent RNA helicase SUPV3L1/SUV3